MTELIGIFEATVAALLLTSGALSLIAALGLLRLPRLLSAYARAGAGVDARHLVCRARVDCQFLGYRCEHRPARHGRHHPAGSDRTDHDDVASARDRVSATFLGLYRSGTAFLGRETEAARTGPRHRGDVLPWSPAIQSESLVHLRDVPAGRIMLANRAARTERNPMPTPRRVAVVVGSLRKDSLNRRLAKAIVASPPPGLSFEIVEIGQLPLYNQDDDANPPTPRWRSSARSPRPTRCSS